MLSFNEMLRNQMRSVNAHFLLGKYGRKFSEPPVQLLWLLHEL